MKIVPNTKAVKNGLMAHYRMEDLSMSAIDDEGNYNGSLNNVSTVEGVSGQAADFTTSNIEIADHPFSDITQFSISMWVYVRDISSDGDLSTLGTHGSNSPLVFWADSGNTAFAFLVNDNNGDYSQVMYSDFTLPTNEWVHVVATFEGGNNMRMFINGQEDSNSPHSCSDVGEVASTTNSLRIGQDDDGKSFAGRVDEVRYYNRALSLSEAQELYNNPGGSGNKVKVNKNLGPAGVGTPLSIPVDGLVARWKLNEDHGGSSSGDTVNDSSDNQNDGQTYNGVTTNVEGVSGTAYEFDGSNYVETSYTYSGGPVTYNVWIYADSNRPMTGQHESGSRMYVGVNGETSVRFAYGDSFNDFTVSENSYGRWIMLTMVADGDGNVKGYYDGEEVAGFTASFSSTSKNMWLGDITGSAADHSLQGKLDEVSVYERELSESEIQELHAYGL